MKELFEIPGLNVYLQITVTLISIAVHILVKRRSPRQEPLVLIIAIYTFGLSGWFGIMSGLFGHILFADQVAMGIGWPVNSGFQMELGFVTIGLGIVGYVGFWRRDFWLPFLIIKTLFMWGAGFTHILHAFIYGNVSGGNVGIILYWDFFLPVFLWFLYFKTRKLSQE
jgi:hypothetical protein